MLPVCEREHDFTGEMKWKSFCWNFDVSVLFFIEIVKNFRYFSFLVHIIFFSIFKISILKIDHPLHEFYNFVIRESCVLGNFEYWTCAKVNMSGSRKPRKFLPYLLILCFYRCTSYIQRCQLVIIDLRYTFPFAIVYSTFTTQNSSNSIWYRSQTIS